MRHSNQYIREQQKEQKKLLTLGIFFIGVTTLFIGSYFYQGYQAGIPKVHAYDHLVQPIEKQKEGLPTPTPTLTQYELIDNEIKLVFGEHYEKAMKVLSCENARLNPNAVNTNTDEEQTRDVGVFQINTKWQGVTNEAFLKDYKINIRMAWSIYQRNGYSFERWTCGRKFGL